MPKKVLLIDGHGLAFRGFYAVPEGLTASDGTPTNAIVGFMNMLVKTLEKWQPDAIALFFDPKGGSTVRKEKFEAYKAGRKPAPDSFKTQLPLIIELSKAAGIPVFIKDGVEADDCIVSTAKSVASQGHKALILSADKDLLQILDENIFVIRPTKGVSEFDFYDEAFFEKKYGFKANRMSDYLALLGDAVDNIPGVAGIGEKSATELVQKYSSIEDIYEHLSDFKGAKLRHLEEGKQAAFDSRELVLPIDVEPVSIDEMNRAMPGEEFQLLCKKLGLNKILANRAWHIDNRSSSPADGIENTNTNYQVPITSCGVLQTASKNQLPSTNYQVPNVECSARDMETQTSALSPQPSVDGRRPETDWLTADAPLQNGLKTREVVFDDIVSSPEVSIVVKEPSESKTTIFCANGRAEYCVCDIQVLKTSEKWRSWCETGRLTVFGLCDLLYADVPLPTEERINDVESAHYMLHPDIGGAAIEKSFPEISDDAQLATQLLNIYKTLENHLTDQQKYLIQKLDLPLSVTLVKMRKNGIPADVKMLQKLRTELQASIAKIEAEVWNKVGEEFNLNSPKQVGAVLFERLKLPVIKKTKTGYSTGIEVLEELARLPKPLCEVPEMLIRYREESKVLSGFVEPFLKLAYESGGYIHSTFDHLATGTGRLASHSPNVQNIPQFGEWAEKFKQCMHPAREDRIFVSADYSQIELRILAHLSKEERLLKSFNENRDVHLETASWVFGLPAEEITKEQRRFAKVVNFGLLYGMSAFGLAQRLGIQRVQAAEIVRRYFSVLPGVQGYIDKSIDDARTNGYTQSIFGRRRPLDEVSTIEGRGNNPIDRIAVNTPVQSSASDIAKFALLQFDRALTEKFPNASLILQVHDSIVCECDEKDVDAVKELLIATMENVCKLSVPLKVEAKCGKSLNEI